MPKTVDWMAMLIALGTLLAMFRFKLGMIPTLAGAAIVGALMHALS